MNSFNKNTYTFNSNFNYSTNPISNNISYPNKYMSSTGYQSNEENSSYSHLISQLKTKIFDHFQH